MLVAADTRQAMSCHRLSDVGSLIPARALECYLSCDLPYRHQPLHSSLVPDRDRGACRMEAHRAVLATASSTWQQALRNCLPSMAMAMATN